MEKNRKMTAKKKSTESAKKEPLVYVGPDDQKKQLVYLTAYTEVIEGVDPKLFITQADLPAFIKKKKGA